ncbi:MAG: MFS transporter [Paracoccaceae bacterium]
MAASARARFALSVNDRVFYGWPMVAVAALGLFASGPGQSHTFSVFNGPIGADLGLSATSVALAYGLATTGAAFLLPVMGRQVDRYGPRISLIAIVTLLGFACMFFGAAANYLWLVVGFGLLRFLGQGSLMLGSANLVAQWFSKKRGFAMSLMAMGFGLSIAVHPKLGQFLIDAYGWRTAWVALGLMTWAIMLPVLFLVVHDKPEPLGLRPDNDPVEAAEAPALTGPDLSEALRHPSFYLICAAWFGLSGLVTALHYHGVNIMILQGLDAGTATNAFVVTFLTMVVMMPLVGRALDRFRTRYVLAAGLFVQTLALVAVTFVSDTATMVLYGMLFGLNNAFTMTLFGYVWPRYFGRLHLGKIQGTGQLVAVIGASVGPIPVSYAFDATGDPTTMIWVLAIYPIVAAAACVALLQTHPKVTGTEHLE